MPWQKLITIVVYAAVATSLGSATQADIEVRDFAVHARFDLADPRWAFSQRSVHGIRRDQPHGRRVNLLNARLRTQTTVKTSRSSIRWTASTSSRGSRFPLMGPSTRIR